MIVDGRVGDHLHADLKIRAGDLGQVAVGDARRYRDRNRAAVATSSSGPGTPIKSSCPKCRSSIPPTYNNPRQNPNRNDRKIVSYQKSDARAPASQHQRAKP